MTTPACPICGKPMQPAYRPFCSKRCADVDLQRWLRGAYAVPAVEDEEGAQDADDEG
ncbi:MAG: DNA gyrase inhibitor YacG [Croceibacterium sp.]